MKPRPPKYLFLFFLILFFAATAVPVEMLLIAFDQEQITWVESEKKGEEEETVEDDKYFSSVASYYLFGGFGQLIKLSDEPSAQSVFLAVPFPPPELT